MIKSTNDLLFLIASVGNGYFHPLIFKTSERTYRNLTSYMSTNPKYFEKFERGGGYIYKLSDVAKVKYMTRAEHTISSNESNEFVYDSFMALVFKWYKLAMPETFDSKCSVDLYSNKRATVCKILLTCPLRSTYTERESGKQFIPEFMFNFNFVNFIAALLHESEYTKASPLTESKPLPVKQKSDSTPEKIKVEIKQSEYIFTPNASPIVNVDDDPFAEIVWGGDDSSKTSTD